jgi:hypothetical protein
VSNYGYILFPAYRLQAQCQPVDNTSDRTLSEIRDEAKRAFDYVQASESAITSPSEYKHAIKRMKFGKASGPKNVSYTVLMHLPKLAITILMEVFKIVPGQKYLPRT